MKQSHLRSSLKIVFAWPERVPEVKVTFKSTGYLVCFLTSAIILHTVTHKVTRKWSGKYGSYSKYIVGNLGDSNTCV